MQEVFEKIKQRIMIASTEACSYTPLTRVISETELENIIDDAITECNKGLIHQSNADRTKKTNFDRCCESIEAMAQIIDIAKIGWTKNQIIGWLRSEAEE